MQSVKRGYDPTDIVQFGSKSAPKLNAAALELQFLLNRSYPLKPASTFIGNHHLLSERQRLALARMVSSTPAIQTRRAKELVQPPATLVLDGFNTIVTLEVALSGSLLLGGMDGTIRDLAGLRGTYRIVDKTYQAVDLLLTRLDDLHVTDAQFYLDKPVSNSGRLRALLLDRAQTHTVQVSVELHDRVDGQLAERESVVTSDAIILDRCKSWFNLNRPLIANAVPQAWIFELNLETVKKECGCL